MTHHWQRTTRAVTLALAAFGNGALAVAYRPIATVPCDHCGPSSAQQASEPPAELRRLAWAACHARYLAAAYLLCDAASDRPAVGSVGDQLARAMPPTEHPAPPGPATASGPQQ